MQLNPDLKVNQGFPVGKQSPLQLQTSKATVFYLCVYQWFADISLTSPSRAPDL